MNTSRTKLHVYLQHMAVMAFLAVGAVLGQANSTDVRELKFGKSLERSIRKGEIHEYKLTLRPQQAVFVELQEQTFDVQVEVVRESDKSSVATANLGSGLDRENLIFSAPESGSYLLRIGATEEQFGNGSYRFSARLADALTEQDKTRVEALRLLSEAVTLQKENTAANFREAIARREKALSLWQKIGDKYWEGRTLDRLGTAHNELQENNQAIEYLSRALQLVKASGDKNLEAATLNTIGSMTSGFGEYQQAVGYFNEALRIFRKEKNPIGIMSSLNALGNSYVGLKDYPKAAEYYQESLAMARKESHKNWEAVCLYYLGTILDAQTEQAKALEKYNQSLSLWKEIQNDRGIALALLKIGSIQNSQGATEEAYKSLTEALKLFQAKKNRSQEVFTYTALYGVYTRLGKDKEVIDILKTELAYWQEFKLSFLEVSTAALLASTYSFQGNDKEAIKYAEMALATKFIPNERIPESAIKEMEETTAETKASAMNTLASISFNAGDSQKALQYLNQALTVFARQNRRLSKQYAILSHSTIAEVHAYNYEWSAALEHQHQALALARELNYKPAMLKTINSIGLIYDSTGEQRKALESYEQALEIVRSIAEKDDAEKRAEASILGNIGLSYLSLGDPQKALEYHNQELAVQQQIKDPRFIDGQSSAYQSLAIVYAYLGQNEKALELLNKSLELFRQAPQYIKDLARNRVTEASIRKDIGSIYRQTGNLNKALEFYNQALQIAVEAKRPAMEAIALNNIALVHLAFGEPHKALQNLNRALDIDHRIKNKPGEPIILVNIAQVYSYWGSHREALNYANQGLKIAGEIGNKELVSTCLNNIGNTYLALSENEKSFDAFNRSLKISREIEDKKGEAVTLANLAYLYSNLGERGKAIETLEQALAIFRDIGDRTNIATALGNRAFDYAELGEYQEALSDREQSLQINREIGDKLGEISQLLGLGSIYRRIGERDKQAASFKQALSNLEEALKLSRGTESPVGETGALHGLGQVYVERNETAKALPVLLEALGYARKYQSRFFEDTIHLTLGKMHERDGAFAKAAEEYQQSLLVAQAIGDKDIEAKALKGLMSAWKARDNSSLAIFYGKQAVNTYQELRGSIRNLKRETQDVYRDHVTDTYRELADLLIAVGHLREAEQVLAMLKEQEAFEFVRRDADEAEDLLSKKIILEPKEQNALARYIQLNHELTAKSQRLDALSLMSERSKDDEAEYQRLKQEVDQARTGVLVFFRQLESEFTKETEDGGTLTAQSIDSTRAQLRAAGPGVVLISTYLLPQRYRVIVSTGRTMVDRKQEYQPLNLDGEQVNRKIMEFKRALQNPGFDPRPLGKELYDIFFKPIEKDIEKAKAKTLLWSLDGSLRYIPVSALYDGKQYLAERYQNVFITLGRTADLFDEPPRREGHVLGLGVSKQYRNFSELPSVPFELKTIVRDERVSQDNEGVLAGIRLLDSEFTRQSFLSNLQPDKNFNIVHLATHFHLGSNLDNSWLLLGDGDLLSLYTINEDSDFDFKNIDLLTLSACETGVTLEDSNGGEVESLGMIAQKNGAKAILATLWKVADQSTALLMSEFYRLRKESPQLTKAEALQMAQREMLAGKLTPASSAGARRATGEAEGPSSPTDYSHPYYWSPFILIGNWR